MSDKTGKTTWLEALLNAAVDSIITIDHGGIIQSANRSTESLFGYSNKELVGSNVNILMPKPWAGQHDDYIRRYLESGEKHIIGTGREVLGKRKDGSTFPLHLSVSEFWNKEEVFFCGIIHDLTARKSTEHALRRSQRLEAIGQLTGGVAHDFNNLLTIITGNLELLELRIEDQIQLELLREAQEAAELGADLTNRLLAFARRSVLRPEIVDINALVGDVSNMLKRTLGSHVELDTSLAKGLWKTHADPGQVETALLNLAVNARDAMPSGGSLIVETTNAVIDKQYTAQEIDVEPGDYIRISVSDTGTGMSDDTLQKVIEPFFTTKKSGRGTGLGLSMVYGFAKQTGGNMTIYSELGFGTTVNLYLPRHVGTAEDTASDHGEIKSRSFQGDGELVLVVEDDPRVRKLTLQRLKVLNYRTISADDGNEALRLLGKTPDIDLVFSDLVMPGGISGYEVADIVHRQHPKMGVLLTSGYAEDLVHSEKLTSRSVRLLRKPYRQAELARALREALDDRS
ncbi:PAS domain S-box protein [Hoeflea sp. TYP-13]|uniref:PAS domain S-box protein n=1 Tax=Hoeflea sp. TYP-13 TaxID=3230023 RepID=UPI0034C5BBC9